MRERVSIKRSPAQNKTIQEEEAFLDPHATTGKEQGKIASLAYTLFEQRGRVDGYDLDDWLAAEQKIVSREKAEGFEPPVRK